MTPISQTVTITVVMSNQPTFDKEIRSQILALYNAIVYYTVMIFAVWRWPTLVETCCLKLN